MEGSSVPAAAGRGQEDRQQAFWTLIDQQAGRLTAQTLQQVLLDQQQDMLKARWNQRPPDRRGWRNGFYPRRLLTRQGPVALKVPRCRSGPMDLGLLFDRYQRRVADVDRILRRAVLLGHSTRDTAALAEQLFGGSLSHQAVSRLMRWLDQQLLDWRRRPILPVYKLVHVDGMYVSVRGAGKRTVMLVAGRRDDGGLDVLDFCVSSGESCRHLLASLRRRGLEGVELFVSDESGAIRSALENVYPEVPWQHCSFHRLAALRERVGPQPFRSAMTRQAACIFRCPSRLAAKEQALAWTRRWRAHAPLAVQQFMIDLNNSLTFYDLPKELWRRARTNNPLERMIRTLRMRLRPIGCHHDAQAVQRAVFGQLARWHLLASYTT